MSHSTPPSRSAHVSLDKDAEARELEAYFRQQAPVNVAAADWHTRWEQGLSSAEETELQQWLAASPSHVDAFKRMDQGVAALRSIPSDARMQARAWSATPATTAASHPPQVGTESGVRSRQHGQRPRAWPSLKWLLPRPALVAFCCATLLAVGVGWHQWQQQPTFSNSYAAARGQRLNATLPDGTDIALDVDTQATVTLYRDRREVRITEGQVMFSVVPDNARPFHVLAGPARVTVVGTRFSVRYRGSGADAGAVNVAVEEGRVRVAGSSATNDERIHAPAELTAGQGVAVSASGAVGQVVAVSPGSVALWRKGMVRFENTSLADALMELERYGPTHLVIRDPAVAAMSIGGSYQTDRPGDFARVLPQILPVQLAKGADGKAEIVRVR
jgi:transmembrane sensor